MLDNSNNEIKTIEANPMKKKVGFALYPQNIQNRKGMTKNPFKRDLQEALRKYPKRMNKIPFAYHLVKRAYEKDMVALAIMDKFIPDERKKDDEESVQQVNIVNVSLVVQGESANLHLQNGNGERSSQGIDLISEAERSYRQ